MKLLTVTVPCYNSQDYMEKCIDSILPGGDRVEIIIIDDGSKDKTGEIADAYAEKYPDIVKVIHQENGGHGEGINQGIAHATGRYFKVVDSDDTLSEDFVSFLDEMELISSRTDIDLFVTNYYYVHEDGKGDRSINFSNALPVAKVLTWADTKPFHIDQILMIHACTFRTDLLRRTGVVLPKHLFYEDNLMVYGNLRYTQKLWYMNRDLYRYKIGREGQSVQENVMLGRYEHQVKVAEMCFCSYHLDEIDDRRKKNYLKHEMLIMFAIAIIFARMNVSDEAEKRVEQMWETCRAFDPEWADYFRKKSLLVLLGIPGKTGAGMLKTIYRIAHRVVRFN